MPFSYLEDIATADVAFRAWGESREELFAAAGRAVLSTMVDDPELVERRTEVDIILEHEALDLLLLEFLQELVFYKDARRLLLHVEKVTITDEEGAFRLAAVTRGEEIAPERHRLLVDVKAVTLYRLEVVCRDGIWEGTVVLDV